MNSTGPTSILSSEHKKGAFIEWQDVNFSVPDRSTGQQKRILTDMHGLAQPGRLLVIMGPSGAGKSTLLDVLACNSSSRGASFEGRITVDGAPRSVRSFRGISCYVQQRDVLMSSATVREVLLTSALLKLPRSVPLTQKRQLVEDTLKELDLTLCANTLIGDETIGLKGISGGQKRRASVGVELVKDPRVLFLDEPSSGLDSEMALSVVTTLVRLARKGRTVVCTIHQPNSDITDCFDDFLLLSGGRTVYGGLWFGAVDFFARNGFSCPAFKNPTDFFMSVVTRQEAAVETLAGAYAEVRGALLAQMVEEGRRTGQASLGGEGEAETQPHTHPYLQQEQQRQGAQQQQQQGQSQLALSDSDPASWKARQMQEQRQARQGQVGRQEEQQQQQGGRPGAGSGLGGTSAGLDGQLGAPNRDHVALEVGAQEAAGTPGSAALIFVRGRSGSLKPGHQEQGREQPLGGKWERHAGQHEESPEAAAVPLWFQVYVLSVRYWRTWIRNPVMMASELIQYVFTALFIGLMYYRFNNVLGEGDYNRASCIWFSFAVLCFTPSYTAVTNWAAERLLLKRELGQRLYGITAYYLARYSVLIPFQMAQCLLFLAVMYFFAGFQASAGGFFTFFVVLSMFQIVSEGIGACCAVVTRTPTSSIIVLTFVLLVLLAFSGFLTATVPVYFKWVQKLSYLTYAFSALVEREFSHITFYDPSTGETVPGMQAFPAQLHTGLTYSQNIGVVAAQVGGMEVVKFIAFNLAHRLNLM